LFLRQKANGEPMTVVGDGLQTRDYTHVYDVVQANILATECTEGIGEIINIGTGTNHSVLDLVDLIDGDHVHIPARDGEARDTKADIGKIMLDLDWYPQETIENWIANYKKEYNI
jgi:UDP-glucose 4-epimerase